MYDKRTPNPPVSAHHTKKLKLDVDDALKTPITTPFRSPLPGYQSTGKMFDI